MNIQKRRVGFSVYPDGASLSLNQLLAILDEESGGEEANRKHCFKNAFQKGMDALAQAAKLERTPIVGVCGTVNSGKSTVVSGFLSNTGKRRILVGQLESEATHRFVFWLPESWRGNGLGALVEDMICKQTDRMPEMLAESPKEAASQYNSAVNRVQLFDIPLVAYDPALDSGGIAFLDCPDFQRSLDDSVVQSTAHLRLERLGTVAPLCSAFVLVASMQQAGIADVGKLFDTLGQAASRAPLYFVLNMTDGDDVTTFLPESQKVIARWGRTALVRRTYLAPFVYREDRSIPACPSITSMDEERVSLADLASELDPAELQKTHYASCLASLKSLLKELKEHVMDSSNEKADTVREVRDSICWFLASKFVDSNGLKSLCYDDAAKQIAESIQRTAPLAIRLAQTPRNWLRTMLGRLKPRIATEADMGAFARVKSSEFWEYLRGNRFMPPEVESETIERIWTTAAAAIKDYANDGFKNCGELDDTTRKMWSEVPFWKRFALYLNIMFAMGGFAVAGALAPIDGGVSVVIWAKSNVILGGGEIIGILVGGSLLGTLLSTSGAKSVVERLERDVARPQMDVLYAVLCDGLGIPRYLGGAPALTYKTTRAHQINEVEIPIQRNEARLLKGKMICVDESAWDRLVGELGGEEAK